MTYFVICWTLGFLLALYPIIRIDRLRHTKRIFVEISIVADKTALELKNFNDSLEAVSNYIKMHKKELVNERQRS